MPESFKTSKELFDAYSNGYQGSIFEPEHYEQFVGSLRWSHFFEAAPKLSGDGKGKLSLPYNSVYRLSPTQPYLERQTTGDCHLGSLRVTMSDGGQKPLKDVKAKEYVATHNQNNKKVVNTIKKPYRGKLMVMQVAGLPDKVISTPEHLYLAKYFNQLWWTPISELAIGTEIALDNGQLGRVNSLSSYWSHDYVYCLEVEDDHSFVLEKISSSNCVSHGSRNACDVTRAVEIDINGESEDFRAIGATEGIYGYRGHTGEGMSCSRAAEFVSRVGGVIVRDKYGSVDFSKYNSQIGMNWGGKGVPQEILDIAKKNQMKTATLIRSVEEARDALSNGYGLACCSQQGFSSTRDSKGFAKAQGSWSHCMAIIGCDDREGNNDFLICNSWGCVDYETQLLTKAGWKYFTELDYDDYICTLNPRTHYVEYHKPEKIHQYYIDASLLHYKYRGIDLMVTDNHNMYIGKMHTDLSDPNNWFIKTASECGDYLHLKKDAIWNGKEQSSYQIGDYIIDMDVWLEFLGYFISEGYTSLRKLNRVGKHLEPNESQYTIGISQLDGDKKDKIDACLKKLPFKFWKGKTAFTTNRKCLYKELSQLGKAHEKYIPDYVKDLSSRQLRILYEAMMVGDGSRSKSTTGYKITYYTSSERLANDVQELLLKIGLAGDISPINRIGRDNGKDGEKNITRHIEYHVRIKEVSLTPLKAKKNKVQLVPYKGNVYCVTVPNHIFLVRRNGKACWTGNSSWIGGPKPQDMPNFPDGAFMAKVDVVAKMIKQGGTFVFSNFNGFPARKLPDYGSKDYL